MLGGGGPAQHPEGVAVVEILESHQCCGVILTQRVAQSVGVPRAFPDQALMGPGEHLDRLGLVAVAGDLAMIVPVGAHQIGQQFGIGCIRLRP